MAVGGSGVFRLSGGEAAAKLQSGLAAPSDLLLVSGAVEFERAELAGMLSAGEARLVLPDSRPPTQWERAWSLTEDTGEVGDGTEVWWLASQPKGDRGGAPRLAQMRPSSQPTVHRLLKKHCDECGTGDAWQAGHDAVIGCCVPSE